MFCSDMLIGKSTERLDPKSTERLDPSMIKSEELRELLVSFL